MLAGGSVFLTKLNGVCSSGNSHLSKLVMRELGLYRNVGNDV